MEENPLPEPYRDAIEIIEASGPEYPRIWQMFAFRPAATAHLARVTPEIMRVPAPLSSGIREVTGAFTSYSNDCPFGVKADTLSTSITAGLTQGAFMRFPTRRTGKRTAAQGYVHSPTAARPKPVAS